MFEFLNILSLQKSKKPVQSNGFYNTFIVLFRLNLKCPWKNVMSLRVILYKGVILLGLETFLGHGNCFTSLSSCVVLAIKQETQKTPSRN